MSLTQTRVITIGVLFALIVISGIVMSSAGKPFNGLLFNFHKLVALGALIFLVVNLHQTNQNSGLSTTDWMAAIITVLLIIGMFITGALLSIENVVPPIILTLHQIIPFLIVISASLTFYLLHIRSH